MLHVWTRASAATSISTSKAAADEIAGATYQTMDGLGHFPMSEDPERFLAYVGPVLEKIRARRSAPMNEPCAGASPHDATGTE